MLKSVSAIYIKICRIFTLVRFRKKKVGFAVPEEEEEEEKVWEPSLSDNLRKIVFKSMRNQVRNYFSDNFGWLLR